MFDPTTAPNYHRLRHGFMVMGIHAAIVFVWQVIWIILLGCAESPGCFGNSYGPLIDHLFTAFNMILAPLMALTLIYPEDGSNGVGGTAAFLISLPILYLPVSFLLGYFFSGKGKARAC